MGAPIGVLALLGIVIAMRAQTPQVTLTLRHRDFQLGGGSGIAGEDFGEITQALFDESDGIFVLDQKTTRLEWFSASGKLVATSGRVGSGPGEMRFPTLLGFARPARVLVYDPALARVSSFEASHPTLKYVSAQRFEDQPGAWCQLGPQTVTFDYNPLDKTVVHVIGENGKIQRSIGRPLVVDPSMPAKELDGLNAQVAIGAIQCDAVSQRIFVAPGPINLIIAYRSNGTLLWQSSVTGYLPTRTKSDAGGPMIGFPKGATARDVTVGFVILTPEYGLLQIGRLTKSHPWAPDYDYAGISSRVIRLADGAEVGRQENLPAVIAVHDTHLLTSGPNPEPWLASWTFEVGRSRSLAK